METPPETNENLIQRLKDPENTAAWGEFMAIYRPVVLHLARNRGLQPADADDLAQGVFLAIAKSIHNWEPQPDGPPFRAWLFTITRNAILNALQACQRHPPIGGTTALELIEQLPDQVDSAEFRQESQLAVFRWVCREVRSEFSTTTWDIFWRTAVDNEPSELVAKELGRTVGAVYVAKWRVLRRIKERVVELMANDDWSSVSQRQSQNEGGPNEF